MGGMLDTFFLKDFDDFCNDYKSKNALAHEALTAFEHFLPVLNDFFDLFEGLSDADNAKISWYSYTSVASSDYIRAKSLHYNKPSFSDVSINMSEEETDGYNTYESACFSKVRYRISLVFDNNK